MKASSCWSARRSSRGRCSTRSHSRSTTSRRRTLCVFSPSSCTVAGLRFGLVLLLLRGVAASSRGRAGRAQGHTRAIETEMEKMSAGRTPFRPKVGIQRQRVEEKKSARSPERLVSNVQLQTKLPRLVFDRLVWPRPRASPSSGTWQCHLLSNGSRSDAAAREFVDLADRLGLVGEEDLIEWKE